ncbi:uncharacterized protein BXZ73DRAFT_91089 [Epithele typhae]|uniref:uncharacterized protein n=1 Tax=Epithele typhae TaxID=378194 RepID=UPI0020085D56|nr:uncharacterized protein BXZ73DRAFT_91089 [Epithele typhae]KAH9925668.1 hypothetical protein BXZ73DRAFT_91089 [Epithele typhae]
MKSSFVALVLSALALSVRALPSPLLPPAQCCDSTVPLLRAYSPSATDHFYTTNAQERANAVASLGYADEGTAAQVFPAPGVAGAVPLYRLYSAGGTDHFYTTNAQERDDARPRSGTRRGRRRVRLPERAVRERAAVQDVLASASDHFYTTNAAEKDNAVGALGYSYEGVAGYVNPVRGAHSPFASYTPRSRPPLSSSSMN